MPAALTSQYCCRWSWFEIRSEICSADKHSNLHLKESIKNSGLHRQTRIPFCCDIGTLERVRTSRWWLLVSLWQYLSRRGIRPTPSWGLWPYRLADPLQTKTSSKALDHSSVDICLLLGKWNGGEAGQSWVQRENCYAVLHDKTE